jgi:hypothetical protein
MRAIEHLFAWSSGGKPDGPGGCIRLFEDIVLRSQFGDFKPGTKCHSALVNVQKLSITLSFDKESVKEGEPTDYEYPLMLLWRTDANIPSEKDNHSWLEKKVWEKIPDDLSIPIGQLRLRVFSLCNEYAERIKRAKGK